MACIMVGPGPDEQGGVASVMAAYREGGLFDDGRIRMLASFRAGGAATKLAAASAGLVRFLGALLRGRADVLHVHVSSRASFWRKALFIWMALLARRRVVFHLHGGGFQNWVEGLSRVGRAVVFATLRRCDRLLCLTSPVAGWLRGVAPGVPVCWWPNPVPAALFSPAPRQDAREPIVLYLGALLDAKGLGELIQAFALLHRDQPQARLVLAGAGPDLELLRAQAAELGVAQAVQFPGWLGPQAKADWLRRARVFCLPSRLEAQPMVLLEALAAGTAVVSTAVGGVPDMLDDGREALLVPPRQPQALAQALARLWNDVPLREQLVARGQARVQARHRADHVCASLRDLYAELVAEGRPKSKELA